MIYENDEYFFRVIDVDDLPGITEHRNLPSTNVNLTSRTPIWPHRQNEWLDSVGNTSMYFIGCQKKAIDQDIALLRISDIDWVNRTAAVGLDVFEHWRGKGHGTQLFQMLVNYCFDILNLRRLWLLVIEGNFPAITIYEKSGFKVEGRMKKHLYRNGKYRDYLLMGLIKDDTAV